MKKNIIDNERYLCRIEDENYYLEISDTNTFHIVNARCSVSFNYIMGKDNHWVGKDELTTDDVKYTILTKEDIEELIRLEKNEDNRPFYIGAEQDEKFYNYMEYIFDKLNSKENEELYKQVLQLDIEYMKKNYGLTDEDIKEVFDYCNGYDNVKHKDKSIIVSIFKNRQELGEEEFDVYNPDCDKNIRDFIDMQSFANNLIENTDGYLELESGKIVSLEVY